MYLGYYGLREPPFSITPDPRFVHLGERHRDALAHLLFGIDKGGGGGFVQLTGEVGTGKTTLSRLLLEQLPENTRIALVLNPRQNAIELLETICEELRIDIEGRRGSAKALVDALNAYLLEAYAQGLRVVLLIDEAQNLPADALEQVRLLTNLETDTQKLLQILLLGQPELRTTLARPDLRQLSQRITARFHLGPMQADETAAYLRHRWRVAGGQKLPFDAKAIQRLHARAGGVPRLVNVIAERALLAGYARDADGIDARLVDVAADEVLPAASPRWPGWAWPIWAWPVAAALLAIALLAALVGLWRSHARPTPATPAATPLPASAVTASATTASTIAAASVPTLQPAALAQLIAQQGNSPVSAWQQVLALWSLPANAITVDPAGPCSPARVDLHCIQGRTRLDTLLALDRPMLLPLQAGSARAWAVLLGADARKARLRIGARLFDVDRTLLQAHWSGAYAGLWLGPGMLATPPLPDSAGPAVDWLRRRLSLQAAPGTPYDAHLRDAVRTLQNARGLPADGMAGPLTLVALAGDVPGPRLLRTLD